MKAIRAYVITAMLGTAIAMVPAQAAAEAEGLRTGTLACKKAGEKVSFLIHSRVPLACTFSNGDGAEEYRGESGIAFGLDMQLEQDKELVFVIIAITSDYRIGSYALEGTYVGAKVSAAVGVGLGANVLIGGSDKSFSLQPVSVEGSTGFGAAAGVGYLSLKRM
jgi:hypothetical protein